MKNNIKIISLDLDGTLLNSKKELTERTRRALENAAAEGVLIVPTTGRLATALTASVSSLPFLKYIIAVNGASIYDVEKGEVINREELTNAETMNILSVLKDYPGIYDCYIDGKAYMTAARLALVEDYTVDKPQLELVRSTRQPVESLEQFVTDYAGPVQKCQIMFHNNADRDKYLPEIMERLPDVLHTCSYANNIEINCKTAHKGAALQFLCKYLGIPIEQSMSFGDGSNDVTMLEMAGVGVAMGNASDEIKSHANLVAPSCDEDGVAVIIEEYLN